MGELGNKPSFAEGDLVNVVGLEGFDSVGKIVGRAREEIIDLWIVQFEELISEEYPFSTCTIPHMCLERVHEPKSAKPENDTRLVSCGSCGGTGYAAMGISPRLCIRCKGTGFLFISLRELNRSSLVTGPVETHWSKKGESSEALSKRCTRVLVEIP